MTLEIIYEDKDIIAINKPAGISVHKASLNQKEDTLIDLLLKIRPEIKNVGDLPADSQAISLRPGLVHRLDKDTSGVIIIAKNNDVFRWLKEEFKLRRIEKKYLALVWGEMKTKKGIIKFPIGSAKKDFRVKIIPKKGRPLEKIKIAETEWRIKKEFENYTLLEVFPKTGRTHQIRVHLSSIGHPIVCDEIYGQKKSCPKNLNRQFLHAFYIQFRLPPNRVIALEAELSNDLRNFLKGI